MSMCVRGKRMRGMKGVGKAHVEGRVTALKKRVRPGGVLHLATEMCEHVEGVFACVVSG